MDNQTGNRSFVDGIRESVNDAQEFLNQTKSETYEKKQDTKNSIKRLAYAALAILAQAVFLFVMIVRLAEYYPWVVTVSDVLAVIAVIAIFSQNKSSTIKMPWIIAILIFPIAGILLYLLVGLDYTTNVMTKTYKEIDAVLLPELGEHEEELNQLENVNRNVANISRYIRTMSSYPVYNDGDIKYYGDTREALEDLKAALRTAEKFIFMEYHAIEDSEAFAGIKEILIEKASQGVDVRVFYDDIGSIGFVSFDFVKDMKKQGIKCRDFNPVFPVLNLFNNHRDHRKITVVDGKVAFTGGYNIADEYFNLTHPYGQWKDTGVRVTGNAVRSFTVMFLEMWHGMNKQARKKDSDEEYSVFLPDNCAATDEPGGFMQPYADTPLDHEQLGENVYMNLINGATKYVWFTTPYLIITDEMNCALTLAAKRGVDVRIITPGIPDKRTVYGLTRSYYRRLVEAGVKIYEYTPGFIHCKQCVADDVAATCGTINLDYRSLYHHFENGIFMYNCNAVMDMKRDFEELFEVSEQVTKEFIGKQTLRRRIWQYLLRLISALL